MKQPRTSEGKSLSRAYYAALERRLRDDDLILCLAEVTKAHCLGKASIVVHAAHHALIVAKVEDGQSGHAVDGNQELPLLQVPDEIVA